LIIRLIIQMIRLDPLDNPSRRAPNLLVSPPVAGSLPSTAAIWYPEDAGRVLRLGGQGAVLVRHPGLMLCALDLAGHLVHAAQGRRVWAAGWRGTRIPARMPLRAASRSGARVELRPRGQRHLWVLLWR